MQNKAMLDAARDTCTFLREQLTAARDALVEIRENHADGGPAHDYNTGEDLQHHCVSCSATSDEYPQAWPCPDWDAANTALTTIERNMK